VATWLFFGSGDTSATQLFVVSSWRSVQCTQPKPSKDKIPKKLNTKTAAPFHPKLTPDLGFGVDFLTIELPCLGYINNIDLTFKLPLLANLE
jgi:hypothetical protein